MEYIVEMIFWVVIAVVLGFLGSSRREEKKVDPNKTVLRQIPTIRYGMYFIGIIIGGMFCFFGAMAIRDGAHKEQMWLVPLILFGVLVGVVFVLSGYIFYARHVFFDEEELIVGRPFRKMLHVKWQEISRMEVKANKTILLYGADGKRLVTAGMALENYDLFSSMARRMCSARMPKKEGGLKDGERLMTRKLAWLAMLLYAVLMFSLVVLVALVQGYSFKDVLTGKLFLLPIMLLIGTAALFYAVFLYMEKIRYTKDDITFYRLYGKKKFLWRNLKKIRRMGDLGGTVQKLYLTWEGKEYMVSNVKYRAQYDEFLDFVIGIALEGDIPSQNL